MSPRVLILTASDAGYFELLRGCLRSIRDTPEGRDVPLAVFDVGLTPEQVAWCKSLGATMLKADWDFEFPGRAKVGEAFKSLTARPFLPRYAPGYDTYLWIDADAWVQDWSAIELLLQGAAERDLAVAPEIHRAFRHYYHAWAEFSSINGAAYRAAFGPDIAERLIRYPLINAGVFAIRADSPAWKIWADTLAEGIARSTDMVDQIALNVAVYERGLRHAALPSSCNWPVHHAFPAWDVARKLYVDPCLPHEPLGILHMTIFTKRIRTLPLRQVGGPMHDRLVRMAVRYPGG